MISKKTINAMEVCVHLANQKNGGYLTTRDLSLRLDLSISHLENILKLLRGCNIVNSMKGPGGGYMINGDISLISMWDIAAVFERTLDAVDGADNVDLVKPHSYELGLEEIVKNTLSNFTLSDFVDFSLVETKSFVHEMGRFKFKPMALPLMPKAPNSVFQLHMTFQ